MYRKYFIFFVIFFYIPIFAQNAKFREPKIFAANQNVKKPIDFESYNKMKLSNTHSQNSNEKKLSRIVNGPIAHKEDDFWIQTNGPYIGGDVYCLATNSKGDVFAGSWDGGAYRSTNNGIYWTQINKYLPEDASIFSVAISPNGYIFASTCYHGIYTSIDNGENWFQYVTTVLPDIKDYSIAVNSDGIVFMGSIGNGVFRSTDNCYNWTQTALASEFIIKLAINSKGHIFAGTQKYKVYRSIDNGNTWSYSIPAPNSSVTAIAFNSSGSVFVGTYGDGIFISTNNGDTWTNIGIKNEAVMDIKFTSTRIFACTEKSGIFISTDNGNTWKQSNNGLTNMNVRSLLINSQGTLIAGTEDGVFTSSDNGNNWKQTGFFNSYIDGHIESLATNPSGHIFAGTMGDPMINGYGYLFRTTNNGEKWEKINNEVECSHIKSIMIDNNRYIYINCITGNNGGSRGRYDRIYRSIDGDFKWTKIFESSFYDFPTRRKTILRTNSSGYTFACNLDGIYCSINSGTSWQPLIIQPKTYFNVIEINKDDEIYVGGYYNEFSYNTTYGDTAVLYVSKDNGNNWKRLTGFERWENSTITNIAFNNNGDILISTDFDLYRSSDNGSTWSSISKDLPSYSTWVHCVAIFSIFAHPYNYIYISEYGDSYSEPNSNSVYYSTNNGVNWKTAGLNNYTTYSLTINPDGYLFAATNEGVFRSKLSTYIKTPRLISPEDNTIGISSTPTLIWESVNEATMYHLQVSIDSLFNSLVIDNEKINGTSYNVTGLLNYKNYFWRVQATNVCAVSVWSSIRKFTTNLYAPLLLSPKNGANGVTKNPTLKWNRVFGATAFNLQLSLDTSLTNVIINKETNDTSLTISGLTNNTKYFWRVNARNSNMVSNWSDISSFTTIAIPFIPALLSPANDTTGTSLSTTLNWSITTGASTYHLQVSTNSTFTQIILDKDGITTTSYNLTGLFTNTSYYWHVSAGNEGGTSDWSNISKFKTKEFLIYPGDANNDGIVDVRDILPIGLHYKESGPKRENASLNWNPQEFKTDKLWNPEEACYIDCDGNGIINANDVIAIIQNWSATRSGGLQTKVNLDKICEDLLKELEKQPETQAIKEIRNSILNYMKNCGKIYVYKLEQNYPNPFNPITRINFSIPDDLDEVKLSIFNLTGQIVWEKVLKEVSVGSHEIIWTGERTDGNKVGSGIYFYKITAGKFSAVKQMLLIK